MEDHYVGAMKGVIFGINPEAEIVDITHSVPKFDVLSGAVALKGFTGYYPRGAIHVAVVDPGVGTRRKPIAVEAGGNYFIGPDNGIFTLIIKESSKVRIREITNRGFMLDAVSSTFHGRDIFAPAAAHISIGADISDLGPEVSSPVLHHFPEPEVVEAGVRGEVVHADSFGNLMTNIPEGVVKEGCEVFIGERSLGAPSSSYGSVPEGAVLALIGSSGFLEIAINQGSALESLGRYISVTVCYESD